MLILDADAVREALPMSLAIEAMRQAFEALSRGRAEQPPRTHLSIAPHEGVSLVMPAFVNDDDAAKQALASSDVLSRAAVWWRAARECILSMAVSPRQQNGR